MLVTDRGKDSLIKFAKLRKSENVLKVLEENNDCFVHEHCRKWFNNHRQISSVKKQEDSTKEESPRETRSMFCWKTDCFICGKTIKEHKEEWHISKTQSLRQSILMSC